VATNRIPDQPYPWKLVLSIPDRFGFRRGLAENTAVGRLTSLMAIALLATLVGCATVYQGADGEEVPVGESAGGKVTADAYLFDTKTYRDGKLTSVRLEVFWTDSVMALGGRAYLGKGALKGRLTRDSLTVYFPTRKEYLDGPIHEALTSSDCPFSLGALDILDLFKSVPDSSSFAGDILLVSDYRKADRPVFTISNDSCDWWLKLEYDYKSGTPRIRRFEFENGERFQLKANRREFRSNRKVKASKFEVRIPSRAVKITY